MILVISIRIQSIFIPSGDLVGETKRRSRIKPKRGDLRKRLWAIGAPWSLG